MQVSNKNKVPQSDENFFNEVLNKYLPYWPLFLILLVITVFSAWLYLRYKVPVYESSAAILIKDEKKGIDESKVLDALDLFGEKKIVENEIEIIRSRTLVRTVVKDLHLYAPVAIEGRFVNRSAYDISPVQIELYQPDSLKPVSKVEFQYDQKTGEVILNKNRYPLKKWINTEYGELRFLPNKYYQPTAKNPRMYFSLISVKQLTANLLTRLDASASSKQSTVIDLTIKDEVPQRGEDILNDLITEYNKAAINDKNSVAANTLAFVQDRLRYVVGELDSVEGKLQKYKTSHQIFDISSQGQAYLETVGANDQKIGDISMQLAVLDQVEDYVKGKSQKGSIVPSTLGIEDPVLSGLLDKLYNAELEYERLKKTTAENNPILIALSDEIEKIKPGILENIHNQRQNLIAGRNDLYLTNSKYASILQTIPQKERELLEISRQQAIKNNIYTFLLQKREETALSAASTVADSRLVDAAESTDKPVSPKKSLTYLIAIIAAFGIGGALIFFKEVINRNILFRSEIESYTDVPILGEVSLDTSKNPIIISEGQRTYVAEQFRQIRTSLGYLGINSRKKKILITSTLSGEGKSFVTTNLGISLALMGKKVVLLELDLRKPKLSEIFKVNKSIGITNFFIGNKEPAEIIKKTGVNDNLFIIPSGPIPPNPSELIVNGKLQELLKFLDEEFDYIIIDSAPVNPVTDAYIISPLCDATLYIIRHGFTPRIFIKKLDEQNKMRGLKNMAIIFNGVQVRGFGGYGGGYGYSYAYGYREASPKEKSKKAALNSKR